MRYIIVLMLLVSVCYLGSQVSDLGLSLPHALKVQDGSIAFSFADRHDVELKTGLRDEEVLKNLSYVDSIQILCLSMISGKNWALNAGFFMNDSTYQDIEDFVFPNFGQNYLYSEINGVEVLSGNHIRVNYFERSTKGVEKEITRNFMIDNKGVFCVESKRYFLRSKKIPRELKSPRKELLYD